MTDLPKPQQQDDTAKPAPNPTITITVKDTKISVEILGLPPDKSVLYGILEAAKDAVRANIDAATAANHIQVARGPLPKGGKVYS